MSGKRITMSNGNRNKWQLISGVFLALCLGACLSDSAESTDGMEGESVVLLGQDGVEDESEALVEQQASGGALAVHRTSAKCASPSGQNINISWGDGNVSTTVYYNNHCNQNRAIELEFRRANGTRFNQCFVAPATTKSSKKINYSNPNKVSILSAGRCP
jgi:hypothetical protein